MNVIITDNVSPYLERLRALVDRGGLETTIGTAAMNTIKDHLKGLAGSRHRGGKGNFYADAFRSTTMEAQPGSVTITIAKLGMAQRFYGGDIRPVAGKYLTIPARDEAYGKRAREFGNLEVLYGRNGPFALAAKEGGATVKIHRRKAAGETEKAIKKTAGMILFWLVKHVSQKADPTVLPEPDEIVMAAIRAAEQRIERLEARGNN